MDYIIVSDLVEFLSNSLSGPEQTQWLFQLSHSFRKSIHTDSSSVIDYYQQFTLNTIGFFESLVRFFCILSMENSLAKLTDASFQSRERLLFDIRSLDSSDYSEPCLIVTEEKSKERW